MKIGVVRLWICLLAGLMDAGTGIGLVLMPSWTIGLMGLDVEATPPEYMSFIGAFVFAVGILYIATWQLGKSGKILEWRVLWLATAWARLCVGLTVTVLIARGSLEVLWISVPVSDLGLAALQFVWRGIGEEANA